MELPVAYDLRDIQNFIFSPKCMNDPFCGADRQVWGRWGVHKSESGDLVALKPRIKQDRFSSLVANYFIKVTKVFSKAARDGEVMYTDKMVQSVTYWINGVVASLLPIFCIWVLQTIDGFNARMIAIAAFNLLLAVCMIVFTDIKRAEVFAVVSA